MKNIVFVCAAALLVTGCLNAGTSHRPVVDYQNSPAGQQKITCEKFNKDGSCAKTVVTPGRNYELDLSECQSIASQHSPAGEGAKQAVGGAAVGAAMGAITGAILGAPGTGAAIGAGVGGVGGAARGGAGGVAQQEATVKQCMRDRGWRVY